MNDLMFLSGFFSIFQTIIIPGIILLKLFKIKTESKIQFYLYTFGLSLFSNYLIVFLLTWLKLYTPTVIYIIFSTEVLYLLYLFLQNINKYQFTGTIKDNYTLYKDYISTLGNGHRIVFIFSCFIILFFISLIPISAGTTYYFIDAINHWTRWPVQWAANNFPAGTGHYPQLFPANISLIYVFTGEPSYQFFPKVLMPLFFIGNLLIFFDLSLFRRSRADLTGLIVYGGILLVFYGVLFILEVNADIPVSFFGFLTFYTIVRNKQAGFNLKVILLVTIFATSAALTKLAGLYILTLAVLWIIHTIYNNRNRISLSLLIKTAVYFLLIVTGSILWYLVRPEEMLKGLDQSPYLVPGYYIRFITATQMLVHTLGLPFLIFLIITIAASLLAREARQIVLLLIMPAIILWAFFFSADFRNLSFVIPFIAYASGYGVWEIYKRISKVRVQENTTAPTLSFIKNKYLLSTFVVFSLILFFKEVGTDRVFNIGITIAYYFHRLFSGNYRLSYFTEIGYYRYVEDVIAALRLSSVVLLILFLIRKLRVKTFHLFVFLLIVSIVSGFSFLNEDKMREMQIHDKEIVKVHNLYYKIYPFLKNSEQNSLIIVNDIEFSKLIPPSGVEFQYSKEIYPGDINQARPNDEARYLLLEKGNLSREAINLITDKKPTAKFGVCFEDEDYIFLKTKV